jgi:hypothetical protein
VTAFRNGEIKDLGQVIAELRRAGMVLSDAVIDRALQLAISPPPELR